MSTLPEAMAYLEKLPAAVSGAGGHNATFAAALACRRFGLSEADTWEAMQSFNARCRPPWSEKELLHKIASAGGVSVTKALGRRPQAQRVMFTAPARPAPVADTRPMVQRSAAEEELWWAQTARELGTTLEEFDKRCGNEASL